MDWRHQAACRDHDPELWFSGKPYEQAAALAICRSCPVIGECRRFADEHNRINGYQLQGIWGGRDVTHPECFGRFTVVALFYGGAIRKCMRRVAQMCADCSAREQLDQQEGARA